MLRLSIAQINPTIGAISANIAMMRNYALQAFKDHAQLVIFPELSLTGYYPGDLLNDPTFLSCVAKGINEIVAFTYETPGLFWIIGAPTPNHTTGKPLYDSLLVIQNGVIVLNYAKQLLPTYNIFDEQRHFESGPEVAALLHIDDIRIGFMICEDGWNDAEKKYHRNPVALLSAASPDFVISINASPSHYGQRPHRHSLFTEISRRYQFPLVYVNQVGGHDQLVFDGASFAVTPQSGIVFEAQPFTEDFATLIFDRGEFSPQKGEFTRGAELSRMEFYRRQIILGLRDYTRRCGFSKVIIGSSGGIDSALSLALAVESLGPENVIALTMPSQFSSHGSVADSVILCRNLAIPLIEHPIHDLIMKYTKDFRRYCKIPLTNLARENLQARIRGVILMEYSNSLGHILITTGNKSELAVGYCTLYGDTNGGLNLIGDLYKTEVFELAHYLNLRAGYDLIPQTILDKEPSAELALGQRDIDSLPPYSVLDNILKYLIEGELLENEERIVVTEFYDQLNATPQGRALINQIRRMISRSEYKRRQAPPIIRLRRRAFGNGWQMPIAADYQFSRDWR